MKHELFRACGETPPCGTTALADATDGSSTSGAAGAGQADMSAVNVIKCGPVKTPMFRSGHQFAINVDR